MTMNLNMANFRSIFASVRQNINKIPQAILSSDQRRYANYCRLIAHYVKKIRLKCKK